MELNYKGLRDAEPWKRAGILLPRFDWEEMRSATRRSPVWLHFGAGNIFRGFIAALQQRLLNFGLARSGIVAAETFDYDIIDRIYAPHDCMAILAGLRSNGGIEKEVIASVARGIRADSGDAEQWGELRAIFENPALQLVSFTITEKGYSLSDSRGNVVPAVAEDIKGGPGLPRHTMCVAAALLLARYRAGAFPVAMVSMDNCSRNGERLRESVLAVARGWLSNGLAEGGFISYLEDESRVSFPWSMIDKITPRPAEAIYRKLTASGIAGMKPLITGKNTYIAPFVNAEISQYLVIEDHFPNGRPALEEAGVYLTDRKTVNLTERMKVSACLNPLHTALAVYGCLLGYESISAEMEDLELKALIEGIGPREGMRVVEDPGVLDPLAFIREVIEQRLPNPFIPDTPQRIATDTSQKIPIRFGETIKAYMRRPDLNSEGLLYIPLALAGWMRYLLAVDDGGNAMELSPDPMLGQLKAQMDGIRLGAPDSCGGRLRPILSNPILFGVDLYEAGLGEKVESLLRELLAGPGAVRATLGKYTRER